MRQGSCVELMLRVFTSRHLALPYLVDDTFFSCSFIPYLYFSCFLFCIISLYNIFMFDGQFFLYLLFQLISVHTVMFVFPLRSVQSVKWLLFHSLLIFFSFSLQHDFSS